VAKSGGEPLSAEQQRLVAAARAGDLDALRRILAEGGDTGTLGFHFAEAVRSALETGDTTWLQRTSKRALRPAPAPHPHKVRARAFAESLGVIDLVSTQWGEDERPVAWGFHVGKAEAAGGSALAIGVSAATPTLVLVPSLPERALATTVTARILACAPSPQLYAGAALEVPTDVIEPDDEVAISPLPVAWNIRDPGRPFPEDALMAVPMRGRTFGMKIWRERVERRVARLERLIALRAPESILDDERRRIGLALLELDQAGWTRELDPLPDHVTDVIMQVLDALEEETEQGPSAKLLAERELGRRLAATLAEPPRLRVVSADGRVEGDDDVDDETS
jgi:hypothetical protein